MPLDKRQKDTKDLIEKIAGKGGKGGDVLFLFDKFNDFKDEVRKEVTKIKGKIGDTKKSIPDLDKVLTSIKGKDGKVGATGLDGKKGDTGKTGKEGKSIKGKDAKNGKDGKNGIDGKDGVDGKDASEEKITENVLKDIPLLNRPIRDSLEELKDDERLDITAIKGLMKALRGLRSKATRLGQRRVGGGFSKIHMEGHFIDNELVGTGDGSTVAFPLDHMPNPPISLKIVVGAGELFLTDDWTISTKTITFLTAPPSGAKVRASYRI